jgi:serine/threonine-protein kinase
VAQIHDYGQASLPGGSAVAYLVMELADEHSLADQLRSGPLPWPQAASICAQVTEP